MTNFEKYKDEILEMAREGHSLAKKAGKLTECSKIRCADCDFVHNCRAKFIKWLYAEPAPTLTKRERTFCEIMGEGYIARDEDGTLFILKTEEPWAVEDLLKLEVEECD